MNRPLETRLGTFGVFGKFSPDSRFIENLIEVHFWTSEIFSQVLLLKFNYRFKMAFLQDQKFGQFCAKMTRNSESLQNCHFFSLIFTNLKISPSTCPSTHSQLTNPRTRLAVRHQFPFFGTLGQIYQEIYKIQPLFILL